MNGDEPPSRTADRSATRGGGAPFRAKLAGVAAKNKKSKKPTPSKTADTSVPVDASLKKRWDQLKNLIDDAKARGASDWDSLWEAAGAIVEHEPPLFVVGGYKNDREFFEEVLGEKARNAYRNIRVAKFASPREENKYGVAKLDAALAYIEAKLGAPLEDASPLVDTSIPTVIFMRDPTFPNESTDALVVNNHACVSFVPSAGAARGPNVIAHELGHLALLPDNNAGHMMVSGGAGFAPPTAQECVW